MEGHMWTKLSEVRLAPMLRVWLATGAFVAEATRVAAVSRKRFRVDEHSSSLLLAPCKVLRPRNVVLSLLCDPERHFAGVLVRGLLEELLQASDAPDQGSMMAFLTLARRPLASKDLLGNLVLQSLRQHVETILKGAVMVFAGGHCLVEHPNCSYHHTSHVPVCQRSSQMHGGECSVIVPS